MLKNGNHENGNQLDPAPVTIGTKVKQARLAAGLTRAQLGDRVKVSAKTIENWEGDQSEPPLKRLKVLGRVLGVPLQEFFDEIEDENGNGDGSRDPEAQRLEMARRKLEEAARLLGGTIKFPAPDSGDDVPAVAEADEAEPFLGAAEFDELRRVVENRGATSAAVPARVQALDAQLREAGDTDLAGLADAKDVDLAEDTWDNEDHEAARIYAQAQLVLGALKYPDLSLLSLDGAADLVKRLRRTRGDKAEFKGLDDAPEGFIFAPDLKSVSAWLAQARPLIARNLVAAFADGKGMLPKQGAIATAPKPEAAAKPEKPANGKKSDGKAVLTWGGKKIV